MKGFIEVYDENEQAAVLVSVQHIIKVAPNGLQGTLIYLDVQNAKNMPYVVHFPGQYDAVKTAIEDALRG